jgi:hypothetical protein
MIISLAYVFLASNFMHMYFLWRHASLEPRFGFSASSDWSKRSSAPEKKATYMYDNM